MQGIPSRHLCEQRSNIKAGQDVVRFDSESAHCVGQILIIPHMVRGVTLQMMGLRITSALWILVNCGRASSFMTSVSWPRNSDTCRETTQIEVNPDDVNRQEGFSLRKSLKPLMQTL
jgi:hypothetical protein